MHNNPRPIQIDKEYAKIVVQKLFDQMIVTLGREFFATEYEDMPLFEISSQPILLADGILDYVPMVGTDRETFVKLQVYSAPNTFEQSSKVVTGGSFGLKQDHYGVLSIKINSKYSPSALMNLMHTTIRNRNPVFDQMYSVFIHEYSHARQYRKSLDVDDRSTGQIAKEEGYETYLNSPREIDAHMQQIIDELLFKYETKPSMIGIFFNSNPIDVALKMVSPEYRRIAPYLTEKNNMRMLSASAQALMENGFVFKRKGLRNNPDYQGSHQPPSPDYGSPLYDLTLNGTYPNDVYSSNGRTYYGDVFGADKKAWEKVKVCHNNPECKVTIYRTIPKSVPANKQKIYDGDWVSLDLKYTIDHAEREFGRNNYVVLSAKVKAKELFTDGNSLAEWGWWSANNMPSAIGSSPMSKALISRHLRFNPKPKSNPNKKKVDPVERFKRWHWGKEPTHQIQIDDDRFPAELIEIGRLMEMRIDLADETGNRANPKEELGLEIDNKSINECYVLFDNDHSKERIYFYLNDETQRDFADLYDQIDSEPKVLNELAKFGGGHHSRMNDYPMVYAKPLGYLTHLVYYTHKKGDDDGIGSGYVHEMGEEKGGTHPLIAIAEDGTIWMCGGSYTCPNAGITN